MQLKWTDLAGTDLEKIEAHIAQENSPLAIDAVINIIDSSHLQSYQNILEQAVMAD